MQLSRGIGMQGLESDQGVHELQDTEPQQGYGVVKSQSGLMGGAQWLGGAVFQAVC